jgi:hypothetical protein
VQGVGYWTGATSTYYSTGGINLAAGCFAIGGSCLSLGNISGTLAVNQGGTGAASFGAYPLVGNGTGALAASSTLWLVGINATSTTATSTINTGGFTIGGSQFVVQQNRELPLALLNFAERALP